ncbi:MAG: carbon-phosphorus lyase complex subunit PhnI, partial [Halobacteria archaeon]|nr:carbon-phosphorus lyase complex subunit PhnI [Halobacteria archaeon]
MYVAVKGGERAIENSSRLLREERRGDRKIPEISTQQLTEQLGLAVARVMAEASLYNPELAALAIKQAQGDLIEAIFLLRAYRTTLSRFGFSEPLDTGKMTLRRRISSTFKDLPGGQMLGPSYDYTHRLLDFALTTQHAENEATVFDPAPVEATTTAMPRVLELLDSEGLVEREEDPDPAGPVSDITREPLTLPAARDMRLQSLARAD